jgi:hypothetical protein
MSTGDKLEVPAEIIRVTAKGATEAEISNELAIPAARVGTYVRFLESGRLLVLVDIDVSQSMDSPSRGEIVSWNKEELAARMREIIDR